MSAPSKGEVRSKANITTVSIRPEDREELWAAFQYFGIENLAAFYRACGRALVTQHKRGERLLHPLLFQSTRDDEKRTKPQRR